jgi:hypothetical protein
MWTGGAAAPIRPPLSPSVRPPLSPSVHPPIDKLRPKQVHASMGGRTDGRGKMGGRCHGTIDTNAMPLTVFSPPTPSIRPSRQSAHDAAHPDPVRPPRLTRPSRLDGPPLVGAPPPPPPPGNRRHCLPAVALRGGRIQRIKNTGSLNSRCGEFEFTLRGSRIPRHPAHRWSVRRRHPSAPPETAECSRAPADSDSGGPAEASSHVHRAQ